ncbi:MULTISPECIES: hypothetical protein [unclassified Pseudomonas]|uniref:hypothetical protein n=1 Tax=unclassified Pseudomonas TaxID=196821 RepID=UPI000C884C42|nr:MULTISPECIES: hypothetical protein [unclassified Pseudomonas]PMZ73218.1 hypothetical protein C1X25_08720 [Pseudomonas sp. GW247-3R2A]PMY73348.1 hypothetical protein C1X26_11715 [Pseudomonas sp. MPR-R3A]PMY98028.1 hypothetical protein C1X24_10995 [Pseudomonas sp. FW305-124]PNA92616.1 hypothetical protein C1X23_13505 [Pseudomonas sp. FW300-E2]PNB03168.1 hypothetical protein C1X27_09175 [Pseudomonas sp. MPR-AND1B]
MARLVIFYEDLDIGAESRFFLQALICREQVLLVAPFKIKSIARLMCLTERLVREASRELADAGLLVIKKQADKVGRPGQEYEASRYLLGLMAKPEERAFVHQDLIRRLFSEPEIFAAGPLSETDAGNEKAARKQVRKDGRPAAPGACGRLGATTRVLLVALLTVADQCGVVTGVGEAKLRAMTGLSPVALKHQVSRLVSLGFIRVHVPGVSNGVFAGAKVPSTYYLNLDHPQLGEHSFRRAVLVYAEDGLSRSERLTNGLPFDVAGALLALGSAALDVLYHRLAAYTSHLLSLTWGEPGNRYGDPASLEGMLGRELEQLKVGKPGQDAAGYYWPGVLDHFFEVAFEWAEHLKQKLNGMVWPGYQPQVIRLIPAPESEEGVDDLRIVSLIVYPAPENQKCCIVYKDVHGGFFREFDCEADLNVRNRYEFGLLTE